MTETLSHIALRRLNGPAASEHYHPFSSVHLSLSPENTLVIEAPLVCADILQTNDIARIHPDGSFSILGRKDNVINSGGIKIQAEEIEKKLRLLIPIPFVITSVPTSAWGRLWFYCWRNSRIYKRWKKEYKRYWNHIIVPSTFW